MDNIEQELLNLQPKKQEETKSGDAELFGALGKKKKKKSKLFSEINDILEDDSFDSGDTSMMEAIKFKKKKKKDLEDDEDLFDTKGKGDKKAKNVEAKFKGELANLQRLLKDNEGTVKMLQTVIEPLLSSKARGSSKIFSELVSSLISANNNRLSTIREIGNLKKSIIDLKIKLSKDDKDNSTLPADQFGSQLFDQLFRQGRADVINNVNSYNQDMSQFVSNTASFDEICNDRLSNEINEYRSEEGSLMIAYETRQPEICIRKDFEGHVEVVAIDNCGVEIDDYPVPSIDQLGKLTFNSDSGTCTDHTGRVFKVINV